MNDTINVNTKGVQFYCDKINTSQEPQDGSTLVVAYWNTFLTLKLHPMLPASQRTEKNKYDYKNNFLMAHLTESKLMDLYEGCIHILEKIRVNDYNFSICIESGKNLIEISDGKELGYANGFVYLTIYTDISENGVAGNLITFAFNKSGYFTNYKYKEGTYDVSQAYEKEFKRFVQVIGETLKASTNAYAHYQNNVNGYRNKRKMDDVKLIKEKLGIQTNSFNTNYNNGFSGNFNNSNSGSQNFGENPESSNQNRFEIGEQNNSRLEI